MQEEIHYPITVKIKLKKICKIGQNEWFCTILDQQRVLTTEYVEYSCLDIETAAQSFRKTEVEYAIINAHYGR